MSLRLPNHPKAHMSRLRWTYALLPLSVATVAYASGLMAGGGDHAIEKGQLLAMLGIAFGTLVSEDLACISAGLPF